MAVKNPFKGVTTEQIAQTDLDTFSSWDRSTLSKAVRRLADTANKRIRALERKGVESPAYLNVSKSGGKFSTRGKTINQLRSEFIRARNFLGMKTSTIKGYEKVKEDFFDRVEATSLQRMSLTDRELNKFWRLYDKSESKISPFIKGSEMQQKVVYDFFIEHMDLEEKKFLDLFAAEFEDYYKEQQFLDEYYSNTNFHSI